MVYNYTKPRGPIAAMFGSPGPVYGLPGLVGHPAHDPRSVHNRNPSYSFGVKHGKWRDEAGPGPCYYPDSKQYRDGRDGTPHYSLYGRNKDLAGFKTPGPGAYAPEGSGPQSKGMPPAYSFGTRHAARRTDQTPGPNAYQLDSMMGNTVRSGKRQAPVFSLRGKNNVGSFCEDHARTPGPGAYLPKSADVYKNKSPQYSLTGRNGMPGDTTQKPGPGTHSPERVYVTKRSAPNFSFGIRHSQYEAPMIIDPCD